MSTCRRTIVPSVAPGHQGHDQGARTSDKTFSGTVELRPGRRPELRHHPDAAHRDNSTGQLMPATMPASMLQIPAAANVLSVRRAPLIFDARALYRHVDVPKHACLLKPCRCERDWVLSSNSPLACHRRIR